MRTTEGLGVSRIILSGHTPYPMHEADERLPHEARKVHKQISKTALGAEQYLPWNFSTDIDHDIAKLRSEGFQIFAIEQTATSTQLPKFKPPDKIALIAGNEVTGLDELTLSLCDGSLEIPMFGRKESFNVVQAAAMALYHCTFA